VTHNLVATNKMLMPSQIEITIRKEIAMTPPSAFLSEAMRGVGESSASAKRQAIVAAQIIVIAEQASRVRHDAAVRSHAQRDRACRRRSGCVD